MRHLDRFGSVAIDCSGDPEALARWWLGLLDRDGTGEIEVDDEDVASIYVPGYPPLDFIRVPEAKTVKNRLHLDLRASDFDAAVAEAVEYGATLAPDVYTGDQWQVLRDPQGNEFCILRPRP